jgi:hypothetical protein
LKAKQTKINYWISRINLNHSFDNLETKQRKMNPWIKRMIINHLIKKNELLGERVFNFQIGPLPSTIIIRSLKLNAKVLFNCECNFS